MTMEDGINRWTAKRKSALVVEIVQGKTTVAEASRSFDLAPSEIESWIVDAKKGMENALRANPLDIKEQGLPIHSSCITTEKVNQTATKIGIPNRLALR